MDASLFDRLTRALSTPDTRRRLLGSLAALPALAGLIVPLPDESEAKDRRRRRKGRHKKRRKQASGKRARQQRGRACKPGGKAEVCAGTCGIVQNRQTCGKPVDCGPCACDPPCGACLICQPGQNAPGVCVPDPAQGGDLCGSAGQVCTADGTCACNASSCPACQECGGDGVCTGCDGCCDGATCVMACPACTLCDRGQCVPCPGCCDGGGACQEGEDTTACGVDNETCAVCTGQDACVDGACVCQPTTCNAQGKDCGPISDGCGGDLACGVCGNPTPICASNVCAACGSNQECGDGLVCCEGSCFSGICCSDTGCSSEGAPDCVGHACVCASNDDAPCAAGETCCASGCVDLQTNAANCGTCGQQCAAGSICVTGVCTACDVTCTAADHTCSGAALQTAIAGGGTVLVCPGRYTGNFSIADEDSAIIIGAGMGDDPTANTILDARNAGRTVFVSVQATATFRRLRITGGIACGGGGLFTDSNSSATLEDCAVTDNSADICSGGGIYFRGSASLRGCVVSKNSATIGGGVLSNGGPITLYDTEMRANTAAYGAGVYLNSGALKVLEGSLITKNTATAQGGGISAAGGSTVTISENSQVVENTPDNCVIGGALNGTCGPAV